METPANMPTYSNDHWSSVNRKCKSKLRPLCCSRNGTTPVCTMASYKIKLCELEKQDFNALAGKHRLEGYIFGDPTYLGRLNTI